VPARKVLKVYFCGSFRPELSKLSADYFCITLFADRGGECACAVPVLPIHVHVHVQREMRPLDWSCLCFALGPPKVWPIMRPYSPLHMRMETGNSSHQPTAKRFWQSSCIGSTGFILYSPAVTVKIQLDVPEQAKA
jgi:hypothetical protein